MRKGPRQNPPLTSNGRPESVEARVPETTPKQEYRQLCETEPTIPIFSRDWWLDATCGEDAWDVVLVKKGSTIHGSMPYYSKRRYGFSMVTMPKLTQTMGPWIYYPERQKYATKLGHEMEVMTGLIDQLPDVDYFVQNFHHSVTNWLPFYWKGFAQTTAYTYVLEDLTDTEKLWLSLAQGVRGSIRKAQKQGIVVRDVDDVETLLDLNEMTFKRQGMSLPYSRDFVRRLDAACAKRGARKIYITYDPDGTPNTGLFFVYDKNTTILLMQGGNPQLRGSGANTLGVWESIKFAASESKIYDFEGSMIEPIETFYRSFGGTQKPYFTLTRASRHVRAVRGRVRDGARGVIKALLERV